jgi:hypothetical protein
MSDFDELLAPAPKHQPPGAERESAGAGPTADAGPIGAPDRRGLLALQRLAGNGAVVQRLRGDEDLRSVEEARSGGGGPIDGPTRVQMEQSFGTDFSDVRVHTGGAADSSARQLGAHAYTVGSDIVFANGRYEPGTEDGQRTLAHELTHVVQQRSGPVAGTDTGGGVRVSDPNDGFERAAESRAEEVVASRASATAAPVATSAGASSVQREEAGEEEEVQALRVQREEAGEEEEVQALRVQREEAGEEEEEVQALRVQREEACEEEV